MAEGSDAPSSQPAGTYKTTRPIFPRWDERKVIYAETSSSQGKLHIEMHKFQDTDLHDFHRLRTQWDVMKWTSTGKIDVDLEFTKTWMQRFMPPNDIHAFNHSVFIRKEDGQLEHIGAMGCHKISPIVNVGYMLRTEWWGKGVATAILKAFLKVWWDLERDTVDVEFAPGPDGSVLEFGPIRTEQVESIVDEVAKDADIDKSRNPVVPEIMLAEIESKNGGSKKVIERCGFQFRFHQDIEENGEMIRLDSYTLTRPSI